MEKDFPNPNSNISVSEAKQYFQKFHPSSCSVISLERETSNENKVWLLSVKDARTDCLQVKKSFQQYYINICKVGKCVNIEKEDSQHYWRVSLSTLNSTSFWLSSCIKVENTKHKRPRVHECQIQVKDQDGTIRVVNIDDVNEQLPRKLLYRNKNVTNKVFGVNRLNKRLFGLLLEKKNSFIDTFKKKVKFVRSETKRTEDTKKDNSVLVSSLEIERVTRDDNIFVPSSGIETVTIKCESDKDLIKLAKQCNKDCGAQLYSNVPYDYKDFDQKIFLHALTSNRSLFTECLEYVALCSFEPSIDFTKDKHLGVALKRTMQAKLEFRLLADLPNFDLFKIQESLEFFCKERSRPLNWLEDAILGQKIILKRTTFKEC